MLSEATLGKFCSVGSWDMSSSAWQ